MNKQQLLKLYNLRKEINRIERTIFNEEFYEGTGFVWFEKLREYFWEVYNEFENKNEFSLLEQLEKIIDDGLEDFDFELLTEKDKQKLTSKEGHLCILSSDKNNYSYCIVKFKNIDESIDYILKKQICT